MFPKIFATGIAVFIFAALVCSHPTSVSSNASQSMNVRLNLDSLTCNKTTEAGEDEVYFLITTEHNNGKVESARRPCDTAHQENCHWNMNDGKEPRRIGPSQLDMFIEPGRSAVMYVTIMEEDGGLPGDWVQRAGQALQVTGEPDAMAAGKVLSVLGKFASIFKIGQDTDDLIGSFAVRVTNDKGTLKHEWFQGRGITKQDGGTMRLETASRGTVVDKSMQYWFAHDGSEYYGRFFLDVK